MYVRIKMLMFAGYSSWLIPKFAYKFFWMIGPTCRNWFFDFFSPILDFEKVAFIGVYVPNCLCVPQSLPDLYQILYRSLFRWQVVQRLVVFFRLFFILIFYFLLWIAAFIGIYALRWNHSFKFFCFRFPISQMAIMTLNKDRNTGSGVESKQVVWWSRAPPSPKISKCNHFKRIRTIK